MAGETTDNDDFLITGDEFTPESETRDHRKEYEDAMSHKAVETTTKLVEELRPIKSWVEQQRAEQQNKVIQDSINSAVETVKEADALKDVPNELVEGFLHARASNDASFKSAYEKQSEDPDGWTAALRKAGESFEGLVEKFGKPDTTKDDTAAAIAAVKGTSDTTTETDKAQADKKLVADLLDMSDSEYQAHKRKQAILGS